MNKKEYEIILDNYKNGFEFYGKEKPYLLNEINFVELNDGAHLDLEDKKIEVIHTPGHTVGGVCYKLENDLYTGDILFEGTSW